MNKVKAQKQHAPEYKVGGNEVADPDATLSTPFQAKPAARGRSLRRYFGQNGEDYLIWKLFNFKRSGVFVDVGAFDGVYLSNTYGFELAGWKGVCVEPLPRYAEMCRRNRPDSEVYEVACSDKDCAEGVAFFEEKLGVLSSLVCDDEWKEKVRRDSEWLGVGYDGFEERKVPAMTLNRILEQSRSVAEGGLDFLSIDVEGAEMQVLKGFDLMRYGPRLVCVEANTKAMADELFAYFKQHGYHYGRELGPNIFYLRDIEDVDYFQRIEFDCVLEKQEHPLGERFTESRFLRGVVLDTRMDRQLGEYEKGRIQAEKTIRELGEQAEVYRLESARTIHEMEARLAEAETRLAERDQQISALRKEMVRLKEEQSGLELALQTAEQMEEALAAQSLELEALRPRLAEAESKAAERDQEIAALRGDIGKLREEASGLELALQAAGQMEEALSAQSLELEALRPRLAEAESKAAERDQEIAALRTDMVRLKEEQSGLELDFKETEQMEQALSAQSLEMEALRNQIAQLEALVSERNGEIDALRDALSGKEAAIQGESSMRKDLDAQLAHVAGNVEELKGILVSQEDLLRKKQDENLYHIDALAQLRKSEAALRTRVGQLEEELAAVKSSESWKIGHRIVRVGRGIGVGKKG